MRKNTASPKNDLTNEKFGRWTVTGYAGYEKRHFWFVKCQCGNTGKVGEYQLVNDLSKSCGCLAREAAAQLHRKHGESSGGRRSAEFRAYQLAKAKCTNPEHETYSKFGGRGIKFLFFSFEHFLEEIGRKPDETYVLARINNKGHYAPGNIEWTKNRNRISRGKS